MNTIKILKDSSMKHLLFKGHLKENQLLKDNINKRLSQLLKKYDLSNKTMAQHMKKSILPGIAVYKEMKLYGYKRDQCMKFMKESAKESANSARLFFNCLDKLPWGFFIFKKLCYKGINKKFCEPGWSMKWIENSHDKLEFHASKCLYKTIMDKEQCSELVIIYCQVDDFMYGRMKNIVWDRKKTLGYNDKVCDFRFHRR